MERLRAFFCLDIMSKQKFCGREEEKLNKIRDSPEQEIPETDNIKK